MGTFFVIVSVLFLFLFIYSLYLRRANRNKIQRAGQAISERTDFNSDLQYVSIYDQKGLAIDNTKNQILFSNDGRQTVMPFKNLIATEILEDDVSISKTNRGSQLVGVVVGSALFGGVGAIVGGLSGSSATSDRVRKVVLRIVTDDFHKPNFDIVMLDSAYDLQKKGFEKNSIPYKTAMEEISAWHSRLNTILKRLSEDDAAQKTAEIEYSNPWRKSKASPLIADEIEKLAQLLDRGLITEAEFTARKTKLLD